LRLEPFASIPYYRKLESVGRPSVTYLEYQKYKHNLSRASVASKYNALTSLSYSGVGPYIGLSLRAAKSAKIKIPQTA
jgi:hypothetical protein